MDNYMAVKEKEAQASKIFGDLKTRNKNLTGVLLMCQRHPAFHPCLVKELELKVQVSGQKLQTRCISGNPYLALTSGKYFMTAR